MTSSCSSALGTDFLVDMETVQAVVAAHAAGTIQLETPKRVDIPKGDGAVANFAKPTLSRLARFRVTLLGANRLRNGGFCSRWAPRRFPLYVPDTRPFAIRSPPSPCSAEK